MPMFKDSADTAGERWWRKTSVHHSSRWLFMQSWLIYASHSLPFKVTTHAKL